MASDGPQRPLTVDDLFALEELGEVTLSPDGLRLAYVLKRPRATASFHKYDFLGGGDRGDVWLVDTAGGEPENLTRGAEDGSGYGAPSWSPDGRRLAMLSTRGGNIGIWTCELSSRRLVRLGERAVDPSAWDRSSLWMSDRTLLVATLPEGERPQAMTVEIAAAETAMREWPKTWKGDETTASVLDSGSPAPFAERPQGELLLIDAETGRQEPVLTGFFRGIELAPDRGHLALLRMVDIVHPDAGRPLPRGWLERFRLEIVTANGALVASDLEGIEEPASVTWSPDGAEVALIGREGGSPDAGKRVFRHRLADGRLAAATPAGLEPSAITWAAGGAILALAKPADGGRADWWLVAEEEKPRKLTAEPDAVPARLVPEEGLESFVGLANGDVLRISIPDGRRTSLSGSLGAKVSWIVSPTPAHSPAGQAVEKLVLAVEDGNSTAWHALDVRSGELTPVHRPSTEAHVAQRDPERDRAVLIARDRMGTRLWLSKPAFEEASDPFLHTNRWVAGIAEGALQRVEYRGLDGDELSGWLVLPVGYEQGVRYPLIADVYPGAVFTSASPPSAATIHGHHSLNPQLLAARGYAVLMPSMPLKREGEPSDPYMELTKGVLPALDRAVELGVADPDRLGVMGQSYGGYSTYGLVTQTSRFRAAVALAGFANLTSLYGGFDARRRYDERPHEHPFQGSLAEAGQGRMGGPPWRDAERYVRNSPLFHADRVETPVLIIQGDMDYVAIQQGEEFFTALYRQGKRARFARYWGEGHVFQSPANVRDMWQQIYRWFDELLAPAPAER